MNHRKRIIRLTGKRWLIKQCKANRNDEITWSTSPRSDFYIWFPPKRNPLRRGKNQSTNGKLTRYVRWNASINIPSDPSKSSYEYSIFCYPTNKMAEGSSSPEMIIS